jgi:hypothetical protein
VNRRDFLTTAIAGTAGAALAPLVFNPEQHRSVAPHQHSPSGYVVVPEGVDITWPDREGLPFVVTVAPDIDRRELAERLAQAFGPDAFELRSR